MKTVALNSSSYFNKSILQISIFNILVITGTIFLFSLVSLPAILFIPFCVSALTLFLGPFKAAPAIILTYVGFDGMLKILSGYNPVIHVASDLLVVLLCIRWLIFVAFSRSSLNFKLPPFWVFFLIHAMWVSLEILNPYGIGLVPGIAAYKIYASFLTLYFFTYSFFDKVSDLRSMFVLAIIILTVESILSIYQFNLGASSVLALSPNYAKPMNDIFVGKQFRPFGTAATPGGASTWLFLSTPLVVAFTSMDKKMFKKIVLIALIIVVIYALFVCQIRSAMLKAVAGSIAAYIVIFWRKPVRLFAGALVGGLFYLSFQLILTIDDPQMKTAQARYEAINSIRSITSSRGHGVVENILYIWENAPFGIGLSRTGAAAKVFEEKISSNPYFGVEWMFADNLYKAFREYCGF
ncbi:MAG: hypothetical protein SGI74_12505 [Oligoflexia bacterium]|nr:hypothetical protein [Oligoflexia bacterium]